MRITYIKNGKTLKTNVSNADLEVTLKSDNHRRTV